MRERVAEALCEADGFVMLRNHYDTLADAAIAAILAELETPSADLIAAIEAQFQNWKNNDGSNGPTIRATAFGQVFAAHLKDQT